MIRFWHGLIDVQFGETEKGDWLGATHLVESPELTLAAPCLSPFSCFHEGGDARFAKLKLFNRWKPIIGAYKPPLTVTWEWFGDKVSGGREKHDHPWQQSQSEAEHFIKRLCPVAGTVWDPMCGSGTSLAAAKALDRQWLGHEIDEKHVATARTRLAVDSSQT